MNAPARRLRAGDRVLELGGTRPLLMGIVNASPDSFSDGGRRGSLGEQLELARTLLAQGADVLDVGGSSARADRPQVHEQEEARRVLPLIERIVSELGALVSVDTYRPSVADAAVAAGARIVNDVSGLRDQALAKVCARSGAALVVMHTLAAPGRRLQDAALYRDVLREVAEFLRGRMRLALDAGVLAEQLILDPGPDFAKTPAQTVELLARVAHLHELGRPLLMAISRKDFIGALASRAPRERLAGTLAALGHAVDSGAHIVRVHDVRAASDYLRVRAALSGELRPDPDLALAEELRFDPLAR